MSDDPIRILLIEDNPGDVRLIKEMLGEVKNVLFALEWRDRLSAGIQRLDEGGTDLVLTDLGLPDSRGLDTYEELHAKFPELPIVVLSCLDDEQLAVKAVRNGAQDYLVKGQINAKILSRSLLYAVQRKRLEKALEKEKRQWERTFDAVPDLIAIIDMQHRLVRINRSMGQFLGISPGKCAGEFCYVRVHQMEAPPENCPHSRMLQDKREHQAEMYIGRTDRYFFVTCTPLFDEKGDMIGSVHVARDITMRKQAETSMRNANSELEEEVARRKDAESKLIAHQETLRNLYINLQTVREEERACIAREIHDELGQSMAAIKIDMACIDSWISAGGKDREGIAKRTSQALEHIDATIRSVKKICTELRPGILDHLGIGAAVQWQSEEFQNRAGINCEIIADEELQLDRNMSTALFRIFQEALTNVMKHANATKITASLTEQNGEVILEVSDNGVGISETELSKPNSYGLLGMRERVYPWKGRVNISGSPGRGTRIEAVIPIEKPGDAQPQEPNSADRREMSE